LSFSAALVVAACGPAGPGEQGGPAKDTEADISLSGPVQAVLWHNQSGALAKGFEELINEFNSSNGKGITIKPEFQGNYTQIYQKMLGAIQAGATPDAVVAVENLVADFAKAGADVLTVHVETCPHLHRTIQQINMSSSTRVASR